MTSGLIKPSRNRTAIGAAFAILLAFGIAPTSAQVDPNAANSVPAPPPGSVGGMGDVNLFPKRVVIDGRRGIATVGLYNKSAEAGDYEIKIVDMAMTAEGRLVSFENILDDAVKAKVLTASAMLRHSPRRVTLRGSESQLVRVMSRAAADLPDGEYRSHFLVTSVPDAGGFNIQEATNSGTQNSIGVSIRPRFGIAIPVIVRVGATTLDVGVTNPQLLTAPDGSRAISFTLTRSGTRSAFGDVTVTAQGASRPIAISKGVGVYPEVDSRQVIVPVDPEADPRFLSRGTRLKIEFIDDDYSPGSKLAEHAFLVP